MYFCMLLLFALLLNKLLSILPISVLFSVLWIEDLETGITCCHSGGRAAGLWGHMIWNDLHFPLQKWIPQHAPGRSPAVHRVVSLPPFVLAVYIA